MIKNKNLAISIEDYSPPSPPEKNKQIRTLRFSCDKRNRLNSLGLQGQKVMSKREYVNDVGDLIRDK